MKKLLITTFVAAFAAFQAAAITVTVDRVSGYYAPGSSAGEFNVSPITGTGYDAADLYNNNSGAAGFGSFCIDSGVGITIPGSYDATMVSTGIDPNTGLQISVGTAWLYNQFARGTLAGYDYNPLGNRYSSAFDLQIAIWILENQYDINLIVPNSNTFLNAAFTQFGQGVNQVGGAYADNNQQYSVGLLALVTLDANGRPTQTEVQPMLTLLPDGGSALLLLGMGLTGLAFMSRKVLA